MEKAKEATEKLMGILADNLAELNMEAGDLFFINYSLAASILGKLLAIVPRDMQNDFIKDFLEASFSARKLYSEDIDLIKCITRMVGKNVKD